MFASITYVRVLCYRIFITAFVKMQLASLRLYTVLTPEATNGSKRGW